jgi:hypothetical protein
MHSIDIYHNNNSLLADPKNGHCTKLAIVRKKNFLRSGDIGKAPTQYGRILRQYRVISHGTGAWPS